MIIDLTPTDDQQMIEEGVRAFLSDRLPVDRLREAGNSGGAAEAVLWEELAGLGLFGLGIPEEDGGLGLSLTEEALVARALGHHLASPSLLAQIVAASLAEGESRAALISGAERAAFANHVGAGTAQLIDGREADRVVLIGDSGIALLTRANAVPGGSFDGVDNTLAFENVTVPALVSDRSVLVERASLLIAAYLTGISQAVTTMAVEYAKVREQFGQPIGAFQAIKHQCADMATRAAAAEAQTLHAAVTFERGLDDASEVAAARMLAAHSALANARANIQIHGGMGFTAECDAHLFLKRALVMKTLGNNRTSERQRLLGSQTNA